MALSVSGFLGMSLCMNYSSSAYSPYLVPVGLVSVFLGVVGFVVMVSGMNRAIDSCEPHRSKANSEQTLDLVECPRIADGMELGHLDDPTAKI
jgi:hypothetical protein